MKMQEYLPKECMHEPNLSLLYASPRLGYGTGRNSLLDTCEN